MSTSDDMSMTLATMRGRSPASLAIEVALLRLSRQALLDRLDGIANDMGDELAIRLFGHELSAGAQEVAINAAVWIRRDARRIDSAIHNLDERAKR